MERETAEILVIAEALILQKTDRHRLAKQE
jgi:hypothetical protein